MSCFVLGQRELLLAPAVVVCPVTQHSKSSNSSLEELRLHFHKSAAVAAATAELLAALAAAAAAQPVAVAEWSPVGAAAAEALLPATAELLDAAPTGEKAAAEYAAVIIRLCVPLPSLMPFPLAGMMGTGSEGSTGFIDHLKPQRFLFQFGWTSTVLPSPRQNAKSTSSQQ